MRPKYVKAFGEFEGGSLSLSDGWQLFRAAYPTEEACLQEICRRAFLSIQGKCKSCESDSLVLSEGSRFAVCRNCRTRNWLTASTFFKKIRKAIAWLGGIWLLEHGLVFNAGDLQRLAGISRNAALRILHRIGIVIEEQMEGPEVDSIFLMDLVGKRSRLTPAKEHPRAEQFELEKKMGDKYSARPIASEARETQSHLLKDGADAVEVDAVGVDAVSADSVDEWLESLEGIAGLGKGELSLARLLTDEPQTFDLLMESFDGSVGELNAAIVNLQLAGLILETSVDRFTRRRSSRSINGYFPGAYAYGGNPQAGQFCGAVSSKASSSGEQAVGHGSTIDSVDLRKLILLVKEKFHAVSRKYLQNYLAIYCCFFERSKWNHGVLLQFCVDCRYISPWELRDYESPLKLKLPSLCR